MNCNKILSLSFVKKSPESFHDNGVGMKRLALKRELERAKRYKSL